MSITDLSVLRLCQQVHCLMGWRDRCWTEPEKNSGVREFGSTPWCWHTPRTQRNAQVRLLTRQIWQIVCKHSKTLIFRVSLAFGNLKVKYWVSFQWMIVWPAEWPPPSPLVVQLSLQVQKSPPALTTSPAHFLPGGPARSDTNASKRETHYRVQSWHWKTERLAEMQTRVGHQISIGTKTNASILRELFEFLNYIVQRRRGNTAPGLWGKSDTLCEPSWVSKILKYI